MVSIKEKISELRDEELLVVKVFGIATIIGTIICIIGVVLQTPNADCIMLIGLGILIGSAMSVIHPAAGLVGWVAAWVLLCVAKIPQTTDPEQIQNLLGLIVFAVFIAGPFGCVLRFYMKKNGKKASGISKSTTGAWITLSHTAVPQIRRRRLQKIPSPMN